MSDLDKSYRPHWKLVLSYLLISLDLTAVKYVLALTTVTIRQSIYLRTPSTPPLLPNPQCFSHQLCSTLFWRRRMQAVFVWSCDNVVLQLQTRLDWYDGNNPVYLLLL